MPVRLLGRDRNPVADGPGRIALLDAALAWISRRDFVTGKEAGDMLRDLRTTFGGDTSASMAELLESSIREYDNDGLWGAPTVADTLLDLRLLVADQRSSTSTP